MQRAVTEIAQQGLPTLPVLFPPVAETWFI
jgi:hypothetical protein